MDDKKKVELERLIKEEIIENQKFISSLTNGNESPSKVSDFKTRDFHGRINLFN